MRHVVIIGGGFGGLSVARALKDAPVYVTLIDRSNHHLFQPLLYHVAMAGLAGNEIATPIRSLLRDQDNARVLLGEVVGADLDRREVHLRSGQRIGYDFLVVAAGARPNFFGRDDWSQHALGLKDLDDAVEIRERVLLAFEAAEHETDEQRRARLLTFVVVGAGPTGVEVRCGTRVQNIDAEGVHLDGELIGSATVLWAAGVRSAPLTEVLGAPLDRSGRIVVRKDCSLSSHPEVFAVGDIASFAGAGGVPLPAVAPVAIQQGQTVGENICRIVAGRRRTPFRYVNKGSMATIGRSRAVAQNGSLKLSGLSAWVMWLAVHVMFLVGFRNRLVMLIEWFLSYVSYRRGARIISGRPLRSDLNDLQKVLPRAPTPPPVAPRTSNLVPLQKRAAPAASARRPPMIGDEAMDAPTELIRPAIARAGVAGT